jgi:hypothetical protein
MGTRAQFFIGNPENVETRVWLGCVAWDGYPDGDLEPLRACQSEQEFRDAIAKVAATRNDFCDPTKNGFPFPWVDDLFLTDVTYAWINDATMITCYHRGWIKMTDYLDDERARELYHAQPKQLPYNTPSPSKTWDRSGPDSIMLLSVPR